MNTRLKPDVFIVEPRLWTLKGHEFDHVREFARAVKKFSPSRRVVVLSAPHDAELAAMLEQTATIDQTIPCFAEPKDVTDAVSIRDIHASAWRHALAARAAIKRAMSTATVTLFFPTLGMHELLILAFLRLTWPGVRVRAAGIFRRDPHNAVGQLSGKYRILMRPTPARMLWSLGLRGTFVYTDSTLLQEVLRKELHIEAGIAPVPVPGLWNLLEEGADLGKPAPLPGDSVVVGYVGEPGGGRFFDLFAVTALAMEKERSSGTVQFLAVMAPTSAGLRDPENFVDVFRQNLPGILLEERWMNTPEEYVRQMNRADIVWAIGAPGHFRRATSGRFTHAVCLGKKVLTGVGGWAQSAMRPCSMVQFAKPVLVEVLAAIRSLMTTELDAASLDEVARWREAHSRKVWDEFVGDVLQRCE